MKLGIYIDTHNLWFGKSQAVQERGRVPSAVQVDYAALLKMIVRQRETAIARAYIVYHPGIRATGFETSLSMLGMTCRAKYAREDGPKSDRNWDTQIMMDVIQEQQAWDVLCLVTTSKALLPLIENAVVKEGKLVELYGFSQRLEWAHNLVDTFQGCGFSVQDIEATLRERDSGR